MKALVTGACGFIGSTMVDRLVADGHDVVGIDNESSIAHDQFYYNPKASYVEKKYSDITTTDPWESLGNEKFDCVFHMAAECRIQQCIENPKLCVTTNILGTINALEYASRTASKKFVLSSTSAIYAGHDYLVDENATPTCLNPYASSKLSAEVFCKQYSATTDLDTVIFRYFNVYGERQPVRGSYAPVIGVFQRQLGEGVAFTIVGDGKQSRDFVHVKDVVDANIKAAQNQKKCGGEIYNIGTGVGYTVGYVATLISPSNPLQYVPARLGEARVTLCDNKKAVDYFGWRPTIVLSDWLSS